MVIEQDKLRIIGGNLFDLHPFAPIKKRTSVSHGGYEHRNLLATENTTARMKLPSLKTKVDVTSQKYLDEKRTQMLRQTDWHSMLYPETADPKTLRHCRLTRNKPLLKEIVHLNTLAKFMVYDLENVDNIGKTELCSVVVANTPDKKQEDYASDSEDNKFQRELSEYKNMLQDDKNFSQWECIQRMSNIIQDDTMMKETVEKGQAWNQCMKRNSSQNYFQMRKLQRENHRKSIIQSKYRKTFLPNIKRAIKSDAFDLHRAIAKYR